MPLPRSARAARSKTSSASPPRPAVRERDAVRVEDVDIRLGGCRVGREEADRLRRAAALGQVGAGERRDVQRRRIQRERTADRRATPSRDRRLRCRETRGGRARAACRAARCTTCSPSVMAPTADRRADSARRPLRSADRSRSAASDRPRRCSAFSAPRRRSRTRGCAAVRASPPIRAPARRPCPRRGSIRAARCSSRTASGRDADRSCDSAGSAARS